MCALRTRYVLGVLSMLRVLGVLSVFGMLGFLGVFGVLGVVADHLSRPRAVGPPH